MNQNLKPLFDGDLRIDALFFDPKTGVIYFWKSIENKKIKFSTRIKIPFIDKAKRVANRELVKRLNKKNGRLTSLIKDELELWLKVKESEGNKYDTMNNIRRAKRQIEEYWGDKYPHEINRDNLSLWFQWWAETHPKIQMENAIKYMRNFCRYLAEKIVNGLPLLPAVPTIVDPGARMAAAVRQKKKERTISQTEFGIITNRAARRRDQVIALILYTMASRIDETLNLEFDEHILLDEEIPVYRWRIGQNKADHWGKQALHLSLIEPLRALRRLRKWQGTKLLFPQQRDIKKALREQMIDWESWRERANLGWKWTPHTFRHTCLTTLFNHPQKKSDALICKQYRVSIQTALKTYIHTTQEGMLALRDLIEVNLETQ